MAEMDYLVASVVGIVLTLLAGSGLFIIWSRVRTRHLRWVLPVIGLAAGLIYVIGHHQITQRYQEAERQTAFRDLASIGHQIQNNLTTRLAETRALSAYLSVNPDMSQAAYTQFLDQLVDQPWNYTNIAAAPDLIVDRIYPVINNESVLGLDYRTRDIQWPAIQQTIRTGQPILIGPIELVQSGQALIIHDAVFEPNGDLWGGRGSRGAHGHGVGQQRADRLGRPVPHTH